MSDYDDIVDLTPQDKFMMMMNDRIGKMEESIFELKCLILDTMASDYMSMEFCFPRTTIDIFEVFLDRVKVVAEKSIGVLVANACVIVRKSAATRTNQEGTIYLCLKNKIIVKTVSTEINKNLMDEFNLIPSCLLGYDVTSQWQESSLIKKDRSKVISGCTGGKLFDKAYE
jgi:hypothetical protein